MVAGLAFQVVTLLIFIVLCSDFALRTFQRYKSMGEEALDQSPAFVTLRSKWTFKGFLAALTLATFCIFWRSTYRVVELAEGWSGNLIRHQWLFVGFEGVMVIIACLALNLFNPAITFKEGVTGLGGLGSKKKLLKLQREGAKAAERSGSASEVDADAGGQDGLNKGKDRLRLMAD